MKKLISIVVCFVLSTALTYTVFAKEKTDTGNESKDQIKLQVHKDLVKQGVTDRINKKIKDYYKTNKEKLLDLSVLKNPDSPEAEGVLRMLEESMSSTDIGSNDDTIGTLSLGGDPPDGQNDISFTWFENGDIILVHDGFCAYGYYRHAGTLFDRKSLF
jgi:hypothetical protein